MMKYLWLVLVLGLLIGCAGTKQNADGMEGATNECVVYIDWNGQLTSGAVTVSKQDIPAFVTEIGKTKRVVIVPRNSVDFGKVVEIRDAFKAAGAVNVVIERGK